MRVAWFGLCGLGLIVAALAILFAVWDTPPHRLALALDSRGIRAVASLVEVDTEPQTRGGDLVDAVRVTFLDPQGLEVRTELTGIVAEDSDAELGWGKASPGSEYLAPLEVIHLPEDPRRAMTRVDIAENRTILAEDAATAALGVLPAALTALGWWAVRFSLRRRGGSEAQTTQG